MTNVGTAKYNLKDRTENFGKSVIIFAKTIPKNTVTLPLISQFVRSGTSIGANYFEADNAGRSPGNNLLVKNNCHCLPGSKRKSSGSLSGSQRVKSYLQRHHQLLLQI